MSLEDTLKEIRDIFKVDQAIQEQTYLSNPWILITSVTMASFNRPEGIQKVYELISQDIDALENVKEKDELKANIVLKIQDALLKGVVTYGIPKTITTLYALDLVLPNEIRTRLPQHPIRHDIPSDLKQRGEAFFNKVYGDKAKVTRDFTYKLYPDLGVTLENYLYPVMLSETTVTNATETSCVMVATLFSQQVLPILKGHQQGARLNGLSDADLDQIYAAIRALARVYNQGELVSEVTETII